MTEGQTKRSHKAYTAWNWKQEVEDLNKASDEGWQLVKGGCFSSKFRYDSSVRYRYQLDFPGRIEDKPRYLETFREQGWEYMNETFNGWYYFRKIYDEKAAPEEYEIFTDNDSRTAFANRWGKIALAIAIVSGLMALIRVVEMILWPCWPTLLHMLTMAVVALFFLRGYILIRRSAGGKTVPHDTWKLLLFLVVLVVGTSGWVILEDMRPNMKISGQWMNWEHIPANTDAANNLGEFDVKYADNYYLDVDVEADGPLTLTLLDENNNTVFTKTGTVMEENNIRLPLKKGRYRMILFDFAGGDYNLSVEID